jgi:hypothetical protein
MHLWQGGWVILTKMTTATTTSKTTMVNDDNDEYPNCKDNEDLIF